jgi:intracellular septation protein A
MMWTEATLETPNNFRQERATNLTPIGWPSRFMTAVKFAFWTYRLRFAVDAAKALVTIRSGVNGTGSQLSVDGHVIAEDFTPSSGPDSVRNHKLRGSLSNGRTLQVEAGYINMVSFGIAARVDGALVHESHPGKVIAFPEKMKNMATASDMSKFKQNRIPLAVDISTGLLFFVVAKLTDLTTAALVGAAVGLGLVVLQRFIKTDILGGMVLFGVVMLLISGGFAWVVQDDTLIKMKSTIIGLIGAVFFLSDGLLGGRWIGKGLARYMPYSDIVPARLAIGVGLAGVIMALLNWLVVRIASTDIWLLYTSFFDTFISMALILIALQWARRRPLPFIG